MLQEELLGGAGEQQPWPVRLTTSAYWTDILPAKWSVEKGSPSYTRVCSRAKSLAGSGPGRARLDLPALFSRQSARPPD